MPSSPANFNPNLHGLRGIAALLVLLFHWGSDIGFFPEIRRLLVVDSPAGSWDFGRFLDMGWIGVPIFFVLSGYLLGGQLLRHPAHGKQLATFWKRRFLRIYPAYWLQLAILLALAAVLPFMPQIAGLGDVLRHVALWINLPPSMTQPLNPVWWTLPTEFSFYLVLPALVLLSRRIGWASLLLAALLVTLLWRYQVIAYYGSSNYTVHLPVLDSLPGYLFTFCVGLALASYLEGAGTLSRGRRLVPLGIGFLAILLLSTWLQNNVDLYYSGHWSLIAWNSGLAAAMGLMLPGLLWPLPGLGWLGSKTMVWLGNISYGIYLWHYPVLMLVKRTLLESMNSPAGAMVGLIVCLAVTLAISHASYRWLEHPLMQMGRNKPSGSNARTS